MFLNDLGYNDYWRALFEQDGGGGLIPARISEAQRGRYAAVTDEGMCHARVRGALAYEAGGAGGYPAVGDFVRLSRGSGDSVVHSILGRRSSFERMTGFQMRRGELGNEVIAANFDFALIVTSLNQDINPRRLERYLASAWQSGAEPAIILTKADIPYDSGILDDVIAVSAGTKVHVTSAVSGEGLDSLERYFGKGRTSLLVGSSGVGKSSLINMLAGEEIMDVGDIREDDSKGRHTTTHRQLILLPQGGALIDTPGMRELGMWDAGKGMDIAFADIEDYAEGCRFSDCSHISEPDCAVLEAVRVGALAQGRLDSYRKLAKEVLRAAEKSAAFRRASKKRKNGNKV